MKRLRKIGFWVIGIAVLLFLAYSHVAELLEMFSR